MEPKKAEHSLFHFHSNEMRLIIFQIIHPWFNLSLFWDRIVSLLTRESLVSHCSLAVVPNQVEGAFLLCKDRTEADFKQTRAGCHDVFRDVINAILCVPESGKEPLGM